MRLIEKETKLKHKKFGEGVFQSKSSDSAIIVHFPKYGEKLLSISAFESGFLELVDGEENEVDLNDNSPEQFDTSKIQIGGKNILEACSLNKPIVFNESYTILGENMKATDVYACYDLTIIGDLNVDKIEVKKSLTVLGNINASEVMCQANLICLGKINAKSLEVGIDLIANSVYCKKLFCGGNAIIKTTIEIEDSKTERAMIAGEGIIGGGNFSAQKAIAVEYFECDGVVEGEILELETKKVFGEKKIEHQENKEIKLEQLIIKAKEIIGSEMIAAGKNSEDNLLEYVMKLSEIDIKDFTEWFDIFSYVIDISYLDTIDNFKDYLFLIYAKEQLPKEMIEYETVEHVFKTILKEANEKANSFEFVAKNVQEIMLALKIVIEYSDIIAVGKEESFDKIFQSIGIKYHTVRSFLTDK